MMDSHAASSEVGEPPGQKSSRDIVTPIRRAAARTTGFSVSGILPRSFQPWTVDGALQHAAAAARTPPNFWMMR